MCPNASSENELSFNINNGAGEISNNKDVLSSIDLSSISSPLREWNNSNKIIPAKSITYIKGETSGESYKRVVYGKINNDILDTLYNNYIKLSLNISYLKNDSFPCHTNIYVKGYSIDDIITQLNDKFISMKLNINVSMISYNDEIKNLISFESNKLGYNFYIDNISLYIPAADDIDDWVNDKNYIEYPLEEFINMFIPHKKYINGAFKGIVIVPIYPKYNNDIQSNQKSMYITHIKDRVNVYSKSTCNGYKRYQFDVFGDLSLKQEYDNCLILHSDYLNEYDIDDNWLNDEYSDNISMICDNEKIISNRVLGLYGYCNYASVNNLWTSFGNMYSVITADDIENDVSKNYIGGAIIYNPNDFDIKVNILTWN